MHRTPRRLLALLLVGLALGLASSASGSVAGNDYAVQAQRYVIALKGDYAVNEGYAVGSSYAVYAVAHDYAVYAVQAAGGTVTNDLSRQIGVLVAESANANFATLLQQYAVLDGYAVIQSVSTDKATKQKAPPPSNTPTPDPLEAQQWGMSMIRADKAHARTLGSRSGRRRHPRQRRRPDARRLQRQRPARWPFECRLQPRPRLRARVAAQRRRRCLQR
jgi:hypothetical protein